MNCRVRCQAGTPHPTGQFFIGKPQAPVCVVDSQGFFLVWCKIDDNQPPSRAQNPGRFNNYFAGCVGIMQHLVNRNRIKGVAGHRELVHIAESNLAIAQIHLFQIGAGDCQHFP